MNRRCCFLLGIILFCNLFSAQAQNVFLKGSAANADGKLVQLKRYADRISMLDVQLDECVVKDREFSLKTSINYPTPLVIQVENYSCEFFAEPGKTYEIAIPFFNWEVDQDVNVHFMPVPLTVEINNLDKNDLNNLLARFDNFYLDILERHGTEILRTKNKKYADTLRAFADSMLVENGKNEYFKLYTQYKIGELEFSMQMRPRKKIMNELIIGQPILYQHVGYMDFFNTCFSKSFVLGTKALTLDSLFLLVNENRIFALLDALGTDPMLKNEVLRELVFLKGMDEAYYLPDYYSAAAVTSLLESFINETRFDEHKQIAHNIIEKHEKAAKPQELPSFKLLDVNKNEATLDKFKGKWVYLAFVRAKEAPSLIELETMAFYKDSIYSKYSNIEFVTIDCDREFLKMYHLLKNSKRGEKYNWTWLHFNGNYKLLDYFKVNTYPSFVILNPKGEIYDSFAKSPGEGIFVHPTFLEQQITKPKEEEKNNSLPLHR